MKSQTLVHERSGKPTAPPWEAPGHGAPRTSPHTTWPSSPSFLLHRMGRKSYLLQRGWGHRAVCRACSLTRLSTTVPGTERDLVGQGGEEWAAQPCPGDPTIWLGFWTRENVTWPQGRLPTSFLWTSALPVRTGRGTRDPSRRAACAHACVPDIQHGPDAQAELLATAQRSTSRLSYEARLSSGSGGRGSTGSLVKRTGVRFTALRQASVLGLIAHSGRER